MPKLPFFLTDLVLLALAWGIADLSPSPISPIPVFCITACVVIGCALAVVPFIVNYVRDREQAATALRHELGEQFKKLMTASEHLQNATAQLKTAEETAAKNLQAAEQLPFRMQEKMTEFTRQLAEADRTQKEATEQELATLRAAKSEHLATIADRIVKAAAEYTKLEGAARRQFDAATQLEPRLASLLATIDARVAALSSAVQMADRLFSRPPIPAVLPESLGSAPPIPPAPAAPPAPAERAPSAPVAAEAPAPAAPPPPAEAVPPAAPSSASRPPVEPAEPAPADSAPSARGAAGATGESAAPIAAATSSTAPVPRKPRAPRKPKVEEPAAAAADPAVAQAASGAAGAQSTASAKPAPELIVEPIADEPPAPDDFSQVPPEENQPAAAPSADGLTRLTVVSYIGIGNKLYLRGEGPGLSWDKGVPLQFVSIGRWRWETDAATGPVTCKIFKNDKLEAPVGRITLKQGTEQEITAAF